MALYQLDIWENWDLNNFEGTGKKARFSLDLYNDENLHSETNIIFVNIILPYLDEIRKSIINYITIEGEHFYFLLYLSLFIIIVILTYGLYLFPMIKYLNNSLFKTKNMLMFIPMKILSSQGNIKSLLN